MEIKIKIEATGLEEAITSLAEALTSVPVSMKPAVEVETAEPKKETKPKAETKPAKEEPAAEPEKTDAPVVTFEQVRTTLAKVSQQGKQAEMKALITSFGVEKLSDIPEEKYAELLEKASDL